MCTYCVYSWILDTRCMLICASMIMGEKRQRYNNVCWLKENVLLTCMSGYLCTLVWVIKRNEYVRRGIDENTMG